MWLITGYFSFSVVIGYMIGSSNSPVVGTFLGAAIGLIGSIAGAKALLPNSTNEELAKSIGMSILSVSFGLLCGELLGESYRNGYFLSSSEKEFVWEKSESPRNIYEAIDWIVLENKLSAIGYSQKDLKKLYEIRRLEVERLTKTREQEIQDGVDSFNLTTIYDKDKPFSKLLDIESKHEKISRGPASE